MKNKLSILFAAITLFAVVTQYYLMIESRVASILETTIRFFSFFTILTNSLVAIYFILSLVKKKNNYLSIIYKSGTLTAVTVYITIVGLVYQILLRHIWTPEGMQRLVDELLHSIIPILVIIFWYLYEEKISIKYKQLLKWLIYPILYLIFILIRGALAEFYPYPFVNVAALGLEQVLINSAGLLVLFICISAGCIKLGKILK
ncbi:Pr6Pr family membrane protein [Flavobacterium algicola]|uniref:Pr6Pr family membrane protein n=1 Tax=Flavobacterium algicola TaxID=556529 RepID=UPI001EFD5781|nr:Pr6Pr family membrane protein [Flavobacterium algicola]MCG9792659.1 Pr6Pr family membrane protein [Flavobacterium algicola]